MPWLRTYLLACTAVLVAMVAALGLLVALVDLGLSLHGIVALFLGAIVTMVLAMALMGLVFGSSRSGHDDDAGSGDRPE